MRSKIKSKGKWFLTNSLISFFFLNHILNLSFNIKLGRSSKIYFNDDFGNNFGGYFIRCPNFILYLPNLIRSNVLFN